MRLEVEISFPWKEVENQPKGCKRPGRVGRHGGWVRLEEGRGAGPGRGLIQKQVWLSRTQQGWQSR